MKRNITLLLIGSACCAAAPKPLGVCEVLKHLNQYEGRQVEMRGAFIPGGSWLVPEKGCSRVAYKGFMLRPSAAVTNSLQSAGGDRRKQIVADFAGTITGWEGIRKRGHKRPVFAATAVSGIHATRRTTR